MSEYRRLAEALWEITAQKWRRKPKEPDIDAVLARAQQEMEARHAEFREQTVRAVTQKNNVVQLASNLKYQINRCEDTAIEAEDRHDDYIASRYRHRQAEYQKALDSVQDVLEETEKATEILYTHLRIDEFDMEARTIRLKAMRTEWQATNATAEMGRQIQAQIHDLVDEGYNHYARKTGRNGRAVLLAIIAGLVLILLFLAVR